MMATLFWGALAIVIGGGPAWADSSTDLALRLGTFRSPGPVTASLHMEFRQERTVHHKAAKGEASMNVELDQEAAGLSVRWETAALTESAAESREHDRSPERLTPIRDAMKELDPARISHLLDQTATLADLIGGKPVAESTESWEGREARKLVYRFAPRLSWTESYYVSHREGRFTVWTTSDGTPLASEAVAKFEGKTSRIFGRFKGSSVVRTRYASVEWAARGRRA